MNTRFRGLCTLVACCSWIPLLVSGDERVVSDLLRGRHSKAAAASASLKLQDTRNSSKILCEHVRHLPAHQQCDFLHNTSQCQMDGGFLNYLELPYCLLAGHEALGLVIVFLWMMYIFFGLSVVVDLALCPSLKVITTALHMDENVAGVTFLAFGNGAADIFSLLLLVLRGGGDDEDSESDVTGEAGMGSIIGGGMFVVCISTGLITINYPLENIEKWPFVRNILFYLASVLWLIGMLTDNKIELGEAIGFIALYLLYVFVVWIGHRLSRRSQAAEAPSPSETSPLLGSTPAKHGDRQGAVAVSYRSGVDGVTVDADNAESSKVGRGLQGRTRDAEAWQSTQLDLSMSEGSLSQSNAASGIMADSSGLGDHAIGQAGIESFPKIETAPTADQGSPDSFSLGFRRLYEALIPEELREAKSKRWYLVVLAVLSLPIHLAVLLTCPTVDQEKENCGWNKYLLMITMVTFPAFAALAFDGFFQEISKGVILGPFLFGAGVIFAVAVALFTKTSSPPSWNVLFAVLSFIISIVWIYIMADEVVNIVVAFAVALDVTGAMLGLLMIAAGNSVCDLIANFFVAKRGNPLMGFAASYGSPLLNMLIGVGIASIVAIIKEGKPYPLNFPLLLKVAAGFLCLALSLAVVMVTVRRWTAGRLVGGSLLALYLVYFASLLGIELSKVDAD